MLGLVAGTADGASQARPVAFDVTLKATITKDWNTVTETTVNSCPNSNHAIGQRTIKLRSARPTTVLVTFAKGRVSYSPAAVRSVRIELAQSGNHTLKVKAPCEARTTHGQCALRRRKVSGAKLGFFRSARNEISFRTARLPELSRSCLRESVRVRALRPGLRKVQGELSEAALADPRIPTQTVFGSAEVTTDLEGQETGTVVERVRWELTFSRKR